MFTHDFNVYETLAKLDGLLESGHDDPSRMDRAEYRVLTNTLVQGTAELLRHFAMHDVLALETAESLEPITLRQVSTATTDSDGGFSDEVVTINIPPHLVPYGAIVETMKTWNVGTIETLADLCVLASLWTRFLQAKSDSNTETDTYEEWVRQADRIGKQCLPAVQQLDAAGLLEVKDVRTGRTYPVDLARIADGVQIELSITTVPDVSGNRPRSKSTRKTRSSRKQSR